MPLTDLENRPKTSMKEFQAKKKEKKKEAIRSRGINFRFKEKLRFTHSPAKCVAKTYATTSMLMEEPTMMISEDLMQLDIRYVLKGSCLLIVG